MIDENGAREAMMPLLGRGKVEDAPQPLMVLGDKKNRVELWSNKITLHRSGALNAINVGLTGPKDIYLDRIAGIQIKKPGFATKGYIQFSVQGQEAKGGVTGAAKDENSILFSGKDDYQKALDMKAHIEQMMPRSGAVAPASVADELTKLVALREQGILSHDEFETQKRSLLDA